jgi:hypothetical protein
MKNTTYITVGPLRCFATSTVTKQKDPLAKVLSLQQTLIVVADFTLLVDCL